MIGLIIGGILGVIIGVFLREPENECPAVELGYNCKWETGDDCDHRKSELYKAKMNMALYQEELEGGKIRWPRDDDKQD